LHPRWGSPWIATFVLAAFAAGCCMLPLDAIVPLVSFTTLATWVLLSLACNAGRGSGTVLVWNDRVNGRPAVIAVIAVVVLSTLNHAFVLYRRTGGWA
jgi:hypothetical protein